MGLQARHATALVSLLLLGLLMAVPTGQSHPFHLLIANEVLSAPDDLDIGRWIAQSIVPTSRFSLSQVSLYVANRGSDVLTVALRGDAAGVPGTTNLTWAVARGPTTPGWVNFTFSQYLELLGGQTYWIVARSTAPPLQGYQWWDSGTDTAYPPGTGARSPDGVVWTLRGRDFSFRVYGFMQPSFTFSSAVSTPSLRPGQAATFRVNFTNGGPGMAAALWVNVSLPTQLNYIGDDAASIGGMRSGTYTYRFLNVNPGSYSFNVTASAKGGVGNGTAALTRFSFEPKDHNGAPLPGSIRDVPVTLRNALLVLSLRSSPSSARAGDLITVNATVRNVGPESAMDLVIQGLVDRNATYLSSSPATIYLPDGRAVRWTVGSLGPGAQKAVEWNARVLPGAVDGATVTSQVQISYKDVAGTPMPPGEASVTVGLQGSPSVALWWYIALAGVGLGAALLVLWPRGKAEEVLLVTYGGILIAHLSNTLKPDRDRDILASMLTAVQDFIKEAFVRSEKGQLRHMDFGRQRILLCRGVYSYLAVVLGGRTPPGLPRRIKEALGEIEGKFGDILPTWQGDVREFSGTEDILARHILHSSFRRMMGH